MLPVCRGTLTQKRVSASFAHRPLPSHAAGQTTLRWRESLAPGASTAVWRLPSGISADILLMAMQECKKTCTSACRCMFSFLFLFFANPFVGPCWCFCFCFFAANPFAAPKPITTAGTHGKAPRLTLSVGTAHAAFKSLLSIAMRWAKAFPSRLWSTHWLNRKTGHRFWVAVDPPAKSCTLWGFSGKHLYFTKSQSLKVQPNSSQVDFSS